DGAVITQFDYPTCEGLGLIKMDFLGLRNLTIINDALDNIRANRGFDLVLEDLALDDAATYALLARGDTLGVFQFDSTGYQSLCKLMQPDRFADIVALGALYRPGPMGQNSHTNYALRKNGRQDVDFIHPELTQALQPILAETYGLTVYQEHVLQIAQRLAGYTLGQADLLRKAMGKKKKEVLDAEFIPFSEGMRRNGFSNGAIRALWDVLVPFASYAFNKAHAAAYGLVSYWTAYLKTHFPAEYMAALLTSVGDAKDRIAVYLSECRRMGIHVLSPDVNESSLYFAAVGSDIRFGLGAVRNVGANVVEAIVAARTQKGAFVSFQDFLDKVPAVVCNKRTIESLIKAGAFDSLGHARRALLLVHEQAVDAVIGVKRREAEGQFDLFADFGGVGDEPGFSVVVPEVPDWDKKQRLAFEREMLGLYVSDHPLAGLEHVLAAAADVSIAALLADDQRADGSTVTVAGLATSVERRMSKKGNPYASVVLEDMEASVEVTFLGEKYQSYSTVLVADAVLVIRGRVQRRDETVRLVAVDVSVPDIVAHSPQAPLLVELAVQRCTPPVVERLREVLTTYPGPTQVRLKLTSPGRATLMKLGEALCVERSAELFADLKALLGPGCLAT
ncbi:MAG: DNA polymerase III subunit alpha, partial [Micrococcales bacterium]|nr:DNA polymerase III subunit alpha [Micrococcales bacterium]